MRKKIYIQKVEYKFKFKPRKPKLVVKMKTIQRERHYSNENGRRQRRKIVKEKQRNGKRGRHEGRKRERGKKKENNNNKTLNKVLNV